jgi:hypothetical protein
MIPGRKVTIVLLQRFEMQNCALCLLPLTVLLAFCPQPQLLLPHVRAIANIDMVRRNVQSQVGRHLRVDRRRSGCRSVQVRSNGRTH